MLGRPGVKEVAGLNCTAWLLNQSHSLQMKEMLQARHTLAANFFPTPLIPLSGTLLCLKAMTASADTVIQRDLPIWWFSWDAEVLCTLR